MPLHELIEERSFRQNRSHGVPADGHVLAVQQVPHRRDENVVLARILALSVLRFVVLTWLPLA
jgi:hypothetical protein